ncbi:unnamed protein product [Coffea canephora]|uniref:Polyprotein n=1 Tax=Coffea canephora TaxID=49390 RepID=A0A068V6T9_COFCA|nr:unnamed protein product [Coffea canephora]
MASSSKFSSITTDSGLEIKTVHSNKLDYLYEVSIEPEVVNPTSIPTINPYSAYGKQSFSPTRVIKSLIRAHPKGVKEYIQASKKQQGYTHIHFGAIRISLSFHGRKGLPVVARIALLDTRFKQYQHACIATTETTLNAGTVFVTLFPNFNMSLVDPHLLEALKVQVQIIGAEQVSDAIAATLHDQMVYRVQNHALDLAIPGGENALLIRVDEKNGASCTHVPRQISKQELIQLLPNDWITDYEDLHTQANEPLESSNSRISHTKEGRTSISFDHSHFKGLKQWEIHDDHPQNLQQVHRSQDIIKYFDKEGLPVSWFQDPISGHIYFDVCNICEECQIENILGLDLPDLSCKKRSKSKQVEPQPCKPDLDPQNPDTDSFVSQRSQFNGYQIPTEWISKNTKTSCPADFPKLETFNKNGSRHTPKIKNISSTILPSGETLRPNPTEDVLNWQTENSLVQNTALISIHKNISEAKDKIEQIDTTVSTQQSRVSHMIEVFEKRLQELKYIIPSDPSTLADFVLNQEKETKFIKDQVYVLKTTGQVPTYDVGPSTPLPKVSSMYGAVPFRNWPTPFYFGGVSVPSPSLYFTESQPQATKPFDIAATLRKYPAIEQPSSSQQEPPSSLMFSTYTNPTFSVEQERKANEATRVYDNPLSSVLDELHDDSVPYISTYTEFHDSSSKETSSEESPSESSSDESVSTDDSSEHSLEEETIPQIHMAEPEPEIVEPDENEETSFDQTQRATFPKSKGVPLFTIDNIPPEKWEARFHEFHAWMLA